MKDESGRIKTKLLEIWTDPAIRTALIVFLVMRVILGIWMLFVRQVIYPIPLPPDPTWRPYKGVAVETNPWLEPWQRHDTTHYQAIAERGYLAFDTALFAPPVYPFMMHWAAALLGGNTLLAGIVISNLAFFGALIVFYRLVMEETNDPAAARRSLIYLAFFPSAFFFLAAYAESLFMLEVILALMAARRSRWITAGIFAGLASITRTPGILLVVPLGWAALQAWRKGPKTYCRWRPFVSIILTGLGFAIFPLYVWLGLHESPWAIMEALRTRGGYLSFPGANFARSTWMLLSGHLQGPDVFDLIFTLLFIAWAVPVWRRLPRLYGVYYLTILALYLTRMGEYQPLFGMTRYVLALFPAFVLLGEWGKRPWINRLILYPSWIGLLFMSGVFALWGWIG